MSILYDNDVFFKKYKALRMNDSGINGMIEEPSIRKFIGNPSGKIVLDIGCGFGQQVKWLKENGAKRVIGIDPSEKMIDEALRFYSHVDVEFKKCFIDEYHSDEKFDLVVSSMALHYVEDLTGFIKNVRKFLTTNGHFIFSIEHPICTANPDGYNSDEKGKFWRLENYFERGRREQFWFVDGVIKYHRTTSDILQALISNGLRISGIDEPTPICEKAEINNARGGYFYIRPSILVISALKEN